MFLPVEEEHNQAEAKQWIDKKVNKQGKANFWEELPSLREVRRKPIKGYWRDIVKEKETEEEVKGKETESEGKKEKKTQCK